MTWCLCFQLLPVDEHHHVSQQPVEDDWVPLFQIEVRCSSVVRAFAHGAMGHWINPSWGGPIELFLVPASAPQLV